jgi:dTDP-4-dehydrorhamnose 3,5-epimerase-like enzyme
MQRDVVKAWHYHHAQIDWWYIPIGQVEGTVLYDGREESPTCGAKLVVRMGETGKFGADTHEVMREDPPGVFHGCRVLSDEAHLFYITSKTYNPRTRDGCLTIPRGSSRLGQRRNHLRAVDRRTYAPKAQRPPLA